MKKNESAVDWLVEQIFADHTEVWEKEIQQAKQIEKDRQNKIIQKVIEIIDKRTQGFLDCDVIEEIKNIPFTN